MQRSSAFGACISRGVGWLTPFGPAGRTVKRIDEANLASL